MDLLWLRCKLVAKSLWLCCKLAEKVFMFTLFHYQSFAFLLLFFFYSFPVQLTVVACMIFPYNVLYFLKIIIIIQKRHFLKCNKVTYSQTEPGILTRLTSVAFLFLILFASVSILIFKANLLDFHICSLKKKKVRISLIYQKAHSFLSINHDSVQYYHLILCENWVKFKAVNFPREQRHYVCIYVNKVTKLLFFTYFQIYIKSLI